MNEWDSEWISSWENEPNYYAWVMQHDLIFWIGTEEN